MIELVCTFIFVYTNLIMMDPKAGYLDTDKWMKCFSVAASLCGLIFIAGPHSSASLNPAVSLALHILKN